MQFLQNSPPPAFFFFFGNRWEGKKTQVSNPAWLQSWPSFEQEFEPEAS